ncbi:DUF7576 family protein [Halopelagius fulvigenes]|uniref:MYM-type domain-containing protein n=1 Tax=Halopelagius fulvigenes TaxID=1198324 RepID=A0ABD5U5I5_9EURY
MAEDPAANLRMCAHCGTVFEVGVRYPVVTLRGTDGTPLLFSFCGEECETAWASEFRAEE